MFPTCTPCLICSRSCRSTPVSQHSHAGSHLALSLTWLSIAEHCSTLATVGVNISPLPQYPRPPQDSGYIGSPWEHHSSQTSLHGSIDPGYRWRRGSGEAPQEAHPWSRLRHRPREEAHKYMSQSSVTAERPTIASSVAAGKYKPTDHTSGASPDSSRPSSGSAARTEAHGLYSGYASSARPVEDVSVGSRSRRPSAGSTTNQTPSRPLGVHSILNPTADPEPRELLYARTTFPRERGVAPPLVPLPDESPRSRKRSNRRSPGEEEDQSVAARIGRRVLTPKSPAMRAASLGARRNPTFPSTVPGLQSIAGSAGRLYTAEPGPFRSSEIPPLPRLAITAGPNLPNLAPLEPASHGSFTQSPARGLEPLLVHQSDPSSASQASYGQMEQVSPVYRYGFGRAPSQPPLGLRVLPTGLPGGLQAHGPHEGYQSAQPSYQMTLDTDQGPMVVPVQLDLQQASKVADEKRKRNAGASARFRARRKEKEKEASQTIAGLQQELRDLAEERDFYHSERNYFRDLASRHVSPRLLQRPPSPRQRRLTSATATTTAATSGVNTGGGHPTSREEAYREFTESSSTAQRRRTGNYQPPFPGQPTLSSSTSSSGVGFPMESVLPPPPPAGGPVSYGTSRSMPTGPPPAPSPTTGAQSYDPYRREPSDRPWDR